jgi:hypothetical protein
MHSKFYTTLMELLIGQEETILQIAHHWIEALIAIIHLSHPLTDIQHVR